MRNRNLGVGGFDSPESVPPPSRDPSPHSKPRGDVPACSLNNFGGQMAEWSGELVSLPAICRLRVRFPLLPGHVTLPTTGASVTEVMYKYGCDWTWR